MGKTLAMLMAMTMTLAAGFGCQSSGQRGGGAASDEGFKITTPKFDTMLKQGDTQTVKVSITRDDLFKQDVQLDIKSTSGITVTPTSVLVKASDSPDVLLELAAAKDAPLGKCVVSVQGTPKTGDAASEDFNVQVVAP
jgi:uncharacterized membrane protein